MEASSWLLHKMLGSKDGAVAVRVLEGSIVIWDDKRDSMNFQK
jgi:hypothetical protein